MSDEETVDALKVAIKLLKVQRDEAVADAAVLAHAWATDVDPPNSVVTRSLKRGNETLKLRMEGGVSDGE